MMIIGIDPGYQAGAAVMMVDGRAVCCWRWSIRRRVSGPIWVLTTANGSQREVRSLTMIGEDIRQAINGAEFVLVVEDLFGKGRTLQRLAESAGEVMGPLRASATGQPLRPGASTWRPQVLGISPRTKADEAEAAAVKWAQRITGLDELASCGHTCEAACIASWGAERVSHIDTI